MKVLHLTSHFGGGVGRALQGVAANTSESGEHCFICLETPEKTQFVNAILELGCEVLISPSQTEIIRQISSCDILQLEWWSHPAMLECLSQLPEISARLMVWCHISGLYGQRIPIQLLKSASRFLLSSECSWQAPQIKQLSPAERQRIEVVHSNGGLESWPKSLACCENAEIAVGYIGSLNFSKLHPDYVEFLASVSVDSFKVSLIGDETNKAVLQQQAKEQGRPELLDFIGYTENVVGELSKINVLAYILNPTHYGTNENALLEAMAMGIVPVVLNNPAECAIVEHGITGLVVSRMEEFSQAIKWLDQNPKLRTQLGLQASASIKKRYTRDSMTKAFVDSYKTVMELDKHALNFIDIFGQRPADWFLSCQQDQSIFIKEGNVKLPSNPYLHHQLTEENKGSVLHFQRHFPADLRLSSWARQLEL